MPEEAVSPQSAEAITKLQSELSNVQRDLEAIKIAGAFSAQKWFQNPSVLISLLALLFSFGTTGVSFYRINQQFVHDARTELRGLIQRLNQLPRENLEYYKKYADDPQAQTSMSSFVNAENALVAKQAAEVIERIPGDVGATEYSLVAYALNNSALVDKAIKLFEQGLLVSNDVNDEAALLRSYGATLINTGNIAKGRDQFKKALEVFQKYTPMNQGYVEFTHFYTELNWGNAELSVRQCSEAKRHLESAEHHLTALPPGPVTESYKGELNLLRQQIANCVPA